MEVTNVIKIVFRTEGGDMLIWTKAPAEHIQALADEYDCLYGEDEFDGAFVDFLDHKGIDYTEAEIPEVIVQ